MKRKHKHQHVGGEVTELARETAEVEQYWIVGDRPEPRKPPKNVKPRFDAYKAISLQIREIFAEYTPIIEPLSLDEAYLDVTENLKRIVSATQIADEIRAKIRAETELTASAGVSYNKFLAKLASDHRKPDGLFVITPKPAKPEPNRVR